ncbi:MAG: hypothetical protein U0793_20185 [Gemmataceae bacterium]
MLFALWNGGEIGEARLVRKVYGQGARTLDTTGKRRFRQNLRTLQCAVNRKLQEWKVPLLIERPSPRRLELTIKDDERTRILSDARRAREAEFRKNLLLEICRVTGMSPTQALPLREWLDRCLTGEAIRALADDDVHFQAEIALRLWGKIAHPTAKDWRRTCQELVIESLLEKSALTSPGTVEECMEQLRRTLKAGNRPAADFQTWKKRYTPHTIRKAKSRLGIISKHAGGFGSKGGWEWQLPAKT